MKTVVLGLDLTLSMSREAAILFRPLMAVADLTTAFLEPDPVLSTWHRGGETEKELPDL